MTQEEKQLLLTDLYERLPYGVICRKDCKTVDNEDFYLDKYPNPIELAKYLTVDDMDITIKPYLRPMSNMTEEENKEYFDLIDCSGYRIFTAQFCIDVINWVNEHHFDYRGLIKKGLALEAPEGMYNFKRC